MTTKTNREAVATEPVACRRCGGIGLVEWTPPEGYVLGYDDIGRMTPCPVCSTRSADLTDWLKQQIAEREAAEARVEELQKALESIAFMRPMGATPKLIKSELIDRIEKIALSVLYRTKKEQHG